GTARVEVRALGPGENARERPADTRTAATTPAIDPATGLPPGVRVATGKPQPAPPSAMDGLVASVQAPVAPPALIAAVSQPAALRAEASASMQAGGQAAEAPAAQPATAAGSGDWRFDMHQDGRAMTADEFDAWMKS